MKKFLPLALTLLFFMPSLASADCLPGAPDCDLPATSGGTVESSSGGQSGGTVTSSPKPSDQSRPGQVIELVNPLGKGVGLFELLNKILDFIIRIGTIVVIFMLVYVGYLFVMARGESGAITTARNALLWTLVGALVLLGSRVIAEGIRATVEALSAGK